MTILRSKNFILRLYKKGDEPSLVKHANNRTIAKNTLAMPYPYTMKDAKEWVEKNLKKYNKKDSDKFILAIEINGEVCGAIGLHHIEKEHKAEIGYWLGSEHWGKGIMTEAVRLMTSYGFKKLKLRRIYAHVFLFNEPSKRVLEKAGYELEGISRKEAKKKNKCLDAYLLAKVR
ncbi:MAG: GNAT family N-acetyltransferase [Candidatus Moranbacteria bacterium]|jgi:RimJ/RimL family protein N-acetyltransferase|nr:GNAT family N-acetyltransferase [Candidatus Moranbacteria bacterium]